MLDVLKWTGIVLWGLATLAAGCYVAWALFTGVADEERQRILPGLGSLVLTVVSGVVFVMTVNSIVGPGLPPDGCYRLTHNTAYVPMNTGKNTSTVIPIDDVSFFPIACP
ncbi:hypothetical protein [Amycolatopsis sp. NPDC004378]